MNQLSEILDAKGREVLRIDADASVLDAVKRMVEHNVGSLLVTDGTGVAGIVTERDYLRRVALEGRNDRDTAVREILSAPLIAATPETSVDECMALMTERRIRHLPVIERRRGRGHGLDRRRREVPARPPRARGQVPQRLHRDRLTVSPAPVNGTCGSRRSAPTSPSSSAPGSAALRERSRAAAG